MNDQLQAGATSLSGDQQELLRTAVREGYFEVPRGVTLLELAERHGLTDQEASEALRRSLDAVVRESVLQEPARTD